MDGNGPSLTCGNSPLTAAAGPGKLDVSDRCKAKKFQLHHSESLHGKKLFLSLHPWAEQSSFSLLLQREKEFRIFFLSLSWANPGLLLLTPILQKLSLRPNNAHTNVDTLLCFAIKKSSRPESFHVALFLALMGCALLYPRVRSSFASWNKSYGRRSCHFPYRCGKWNMRWVLCVCVRGGEMVLSESAVCGAI